MSLYKISVMARLRYLVIHGTPSDGDLGRPPRTACTIYGKKILDGWDDARNLETNMFWMETLSDQGFSWSELLRRETRLFQEGKVEFQFEGNHTKKQFRRQIGSEKAIKTKEARTTFWQNEKGETGNRRRAAIAAERVRNSY